jgi:pimeloyl-ACP methyl ester carboxylesterase
MLRPILLLAAATCAFAGSPLAAGTASAAKPAILAPAPVSYRTVNVDGVKIFYREAGPTNAPVILLLHGFPTSSHMFRDLIPALSSHYRVIAPDYPGYGYSDAPSPEKFSYTFDNMARIMEGFVRAKGLTRYALYMQDFGGPVGFRLATAYPERVTALIIQNANAYEEGFSEAMNGARPAWEKRTPETEAAFRGLLTLDGTKQQYLAGISDPSSVNPDAWMHAQAGLDRPGNDVIQLAMLHDYGSNPKLYPQWQAYMRKHQPPTLITWGKGDPFFLVPGAKAYARDLPKAEMHILDAGHFALETHSAEIANLIRDFLGRNLRNR